MYKANQEALFQATNQGLINIRQSEINYYLSVNSAIGTQAALIGGFTYGIFTQNVANPSNSWAANCQTVYYIITATTIAASVHVIINTMLLQVLGPGLALNGPIGSMARATEGMQKEQGQVIWSFTLMIICFALSTVMSFWVVMDKIASTVNTVIFVVAARFWIVYSKRVFLRFYWDKEATKGTTWTGQQESEDDDDEPTIAKKLGGGGPDSKSPMHLSDGTGAGREMQEHRSSKKRQASTSGGSRMGSMRLNVFNWLKPSDQEIRESLSEVDRYAASEQSKYRGGSGSKEVVMEGYLTKRGIARSEFIKDPWERRYFVLNGRAEIFYYKNRQDFRQDPTLRIKDRPIKLEEFLVIDTSTVASSVADDASTSSAGGDSSQLKFQISLVPREEEGSRQWMLRCDTEELIHEWLQAMRAVSPTSFPDSTGANAV